jgi:hypothetical protein
MVLHNKYSLINTDCPLCPHEGKLRQYAFAPKKVKITQNIDGKRVEILKS